uniref:Putative juvenile hormone esterase binding protein n=1 Tax=Amblyomma tuberculatum TaxID=48802 RepID=A0A6M2E5V7_9ACAR
MAVLRSVALSALRLQLFHGKKFFRVCASATAACVHVTGLSYQCAWALQPRSLLVPPGAGIACQRYPTPTLCVRPVRRCSSRSGSGHSGFDLMRNSHIVWPNLILTIKNWLQTMFIVKPYLDATFSQREFLDGAKQALTYVSVLMANEDFKSMEGLVTSDVVSAAQSNCCSLSVEQRKKLTVDLSDIYFCFLYQIGIIMDDNSNQRFVEATVVYHYVPGLEEMRQNAAMMNETVQQLQDRVHVANYRFIRDYTKGTESDWTINQLNHFKLSAVA